MARKAKVTRRTFNQSDLISRSIKGRYDAAQRSTENANLWSNVDGLSAAAANNPSVRKVIRDRARYEIANNSYAAGIVKTLANDVVGPVIQIQLGNGEKQQVAELDFQAWAKAAELFAKLRTARKAKCQDGEAFAQLFTNPKIKNEIKLDVKLLECDQIEGFYTGKADEVDGVKLDSYGNPIAYRVLKEHPGDYRFSAFGKTGGDWVARKFMLHYFDSDRPGQIRGVSEITSSLSLFGLLRKYTIAVTETATRAAEISGVLTTSLLPEGDSAVTFAEPSITMEFGRNCMVSTPEGWDLKQLKAEQPTTQYKDFKAEIITEVARPLNMPANVARGDSSGYNYASGRLDFQTYDRSIEVDREGLERDMLNRIYDNWLAEYKARKALSKEDVLAISNPQWYYSGRGHVDPEKEAKADNVRLQNGTLTKGDYWASQGEDSKRKEKQRIDEMISGEVMWNEARAAAKLPPAPYPYAAPAENPATVAPPEPDEDDNNQNGDNDDE